MTSPLDSRREWVLRTLIEAYLAEGEPVGSRTLAKRHPEPLSSATIRNVLADLEDEALLAQPHTSAGRIPTERAYRYYVDHWVRPLKPDPELAARLEGSLKGLGEDPEAWLRHASKVLSEVMGGICAALPVPLRASRLLRLEFVPLGANRLVAVWVGRSGEVEHQVMDNRWGLSEAALTELGNFATAQFLGCSLEELRQKVLLRLQDHAAEARQLCERLASLTERMADQEEPAEAPLVLSGLGELGKLPEFEDARRFRELVEAFEEHERLARVLNAFAEAAGRELTLLLGSENPFLPALPLATAMRTLDLPGAERVTFAFVGPLRMDYGRVLGGLDWWSAELLRRGGRGAG